MDLIIKQQEIKTILEGVHEDYTHTFEYSNITGKLPVYIGFSLKKDELEFASGGYYVETSQMSINVYSYNQDNTNLLRDLHLQITKILEDIDLTI
ncbi:hypothetical protein ACYSNM_03515 [Myroides sp. LJL116]